MTRIIEALAEIADDYDALFCDLWGCIHDGVHAHAEAVAALRAFRAEGGVVIVVTNSPRPHAEAAEIQLRGFGVPDDAWDAVATSGDSARAAMFRGAVGQRVHHIGPSRNDVFFKPMEVVENVGIERVPLEDAEGLVVTGPLDEDRDTPADYRPTFLYAKQKRLPLLCANPTSGWIAATSASSAPARWPWNTPGWGANRSTSASRTRRSTTSPGAGCSASATSPTTGSCASATASRPTSRAPWERVSTWSSSPAGSRRRRPARWSSPTPRGWRPFSPRPRRARPTAVGKLR